MEQSQSTDRSHETSDLSLYCFHRAGLTLTQWTTHVEQELCPALTALNLISSDGKADWRTIEQFDRSAPHGDRVSESPKTSRAIRLSTRNTYGRYELTDCSSKVKSTTIERLEQRTGVEYVLLPEKFSAFRTERGLAVFDMDSTLIQQEVIDELARAIGKYDQVAAITAAAMRGEAPYTDFEASLRARVGLLNGVPTTIWDELKQSTITFTPGAKELVKALKAAGWKTAVLSGGFIPLADWVKETLGLDYAYANHLVEKDGILTGELVEGKPIIHAEKKRELFIEIAKQEKIDLKLSIAVGDGSNDLKMMGVAGLGIAFHAKPKVQAAAPVRMNTHTLLDVMYLLGFDENEVNQLLEKGSPC